MRHTAQPLTAGDRHGFPVLVECALQRKAWCMASFEEEGSVVAVIGDLCGYLAAPHHGIRDDGLVGVHCDVLHGDLLLAIAPMAVERLGKPRERSRGLVGECQVPGTDLEALFRDPGALRLLFGRARSTGALEPGNAASICRRTYILAAGSLENAVPRLPMCFPMSTSRPTTSECARQLTVRPAVPLSEGAEVTPDERSSLINSPSRSRGHARRPSRLPPPLRFRPGGVLRHRSFRTRERNCSRRPIASSSVRWREPILQSCGFSIAVFLLGLLSALRLALENRLHHPRHSRLLRLLAKAGDRLGGWLMRNDHTAAVRVYR